MIDTSASQAVDAPNKEEDIKQVEEIKQDIQNQQPVEEEEEKKSPTNNQAPQVQWNETIYRRHRTDTLA